MSLPNIKGEYRLNYNLSNLTWFKVGGAADILFKPLDVEDLSSFLRQKQEQLPVSILGAGSNVLVRDNGIEGVVIKLGKSFTNIELTVDGNLAVGAGCLNFSLAKFCEANSITGFEFLIGIPGTIGGGVIMNAGAYGREFKDIILAAEVIDAKGNIFTVKSTDIGFKYRGNNLPENVIITKVIFKTTSGVQKDIKALMDEINAKRLATQPIKELTSGSTFSNPVGAYKAWQLIDEVGLRGYRIGDASISMLHCNFMINHGKALAKDLEDLGELVRQKVFDRTGIKLDWEIKRIGRYA